VPEYDIARVPLDVTGEPVTEKMDGVVKATDVTVPPDVIVCHVAAPATDVAVNTCPITGIFVERANVPAAATSGIV
jgi:hypothetical protein